MDFVSNVTYDVRLNDIWGYTAPDGTEYALVGMITGVSVVSLANPAEPVEVHFVPGVSSTWRDIKTFAGYAYIINEQSNGLQVIDLTGLPETIDFYDWTPTIERVGTLSTCHNIYIDEDGYAYLAGCNVNGGGLFIADVFTTPGTPQFVSVGSPEYSHDIYVRDNIAYSSEINRGIFSMYDVTDKEAIVRLGGAETDFTFTHNVWVSDDGNTLFTTDERANAPVGAYDISDPQDIRKLDQFRPQATINTGVIPHNAHVIDDYVVVSYYTDGCVVIDGSRPHNLVEVGNYDTYTDPGTGFEGAWGAYPFLPSGLVLISDRSNGLFVVQPNYKRACWLEGNITDEASGQPINGATLEIKDLNLLDDSDVRGDYFTGHHQAGTYTVTVSKLGYITAESEVDLINGEAKFMDFTLQSIPRIVVTGQATDNNGASIGNADVRFSSPELDYEVVTDENGSFTIDDFIPGEYSVSAGKWGCIFTSIDSRMYDPSNTSVTIQAKIGYEDTFAFDMGWQVFSSNPVSVWERTTPTMENFGLIIAPLEDSDQDADNYCYLTGNDLSINNGLLNRNSTSLVSPEFDVSEYKRPTIRFNYWYLMVNFEFMPRPEPLLVEIFNGQDRVILDDISFSDFDSLGWTDYEIDILEHLPATDKMSITITVDTQSGPLIAEAGIDYFRVVDTESTATDELLTQQIKMSAYPNPSKNGFNLEYNLDQGYQYTLLVYDILGNDVTKSLVGGNSHTFGEDLKPGVYFAQLSNGVSLTRSIRLIKL